MPNRINTTGTTIGTSGLLCLALMFSVTPVRAEPAEYRIDPEHVTVAFLVGHAAYANVLGQFLEVEGSYVFDEETGALSDIEVVVNTDSVFSNHDDRDDHLRSGDFLNSRRNPEMTFTADTGARTSQQTFEIAGQLELLGVARPLTLQATWNKSADYPFGRSAWVMGVSARGTVMRSEFGMSYALEGDLVGDEVEIIIEFEARRQ